MEIHCSLILDSDIPCTGSVGGLEACAPAYVEPPLGYHSWDIGVLTCGRESGRGALSSGQFGWGGRLPEGSGGAQSLAQHGWKSCNECKRISQVDCETDGSSRYESRS